MIAWKATREAAHALSAAIPLLGAQRINVVLDADITPTDRELLRVFMRRHGLRASEHMWPPPHPRRAKRFCRWLPTSAAISSARRFLIFPKGARSRPNALRIGPI
jgi:hypothetical protein